MKFKQNQLLKKSLKVLLVLVGLLGFAFISLIIYFKFIYSSEAPAESYYVEDLSMFY